MCEIFMRENRESASRDGTLHSKAGIGESSLQKSPVVTVHLKALISGASREHESRAQVEVMAWVEECVRPNVQLIMPPAVGHNIVPGKQANKGNTVAPAEPVEFVAKDVTKRNTLENAAGATQDTAPGYCADLPGVYMERV
jgi:hypothetical protein